MRSLHREMPSFILSMPLKEKARLYKPIFCIAFESDCRIVIQDSFYFQNGL